MSTQTTALFTRKGLVLAKVETTEGTDAAPSAGNAIRVEMGANPVSIDFAMENTTEVSGSYDDSDSIPTGAKATVTFSVLMRGAASAGTAPPWGVLLKACGFAETLTATAAPASAEVCASGTTTTATLGATASSTAQAYRGMPVEFSEGPDGVSFISNYTTGKVATLTDTMGEAVDSSTEYQVLPNARYAPTSTDSDIKALTLWVYQSGVLWKLTGCRGTPTFRFPSGGVPRIEFQFMGIFQARIDASLPVVDFSTLADPPIFRGGRSLINRTVAATSTITLQTGNRIVQPGDPNAAEGFGVGLLTGRKLSLEMDPLTTLVATRDTITDLRAGTTRIVHFRMGAAAGNRIAVTVPAGKAVNRTDAEQEGILRETITVQCSGADAAAAQITVY